MGYLAEGGREETHTRQHLITPKRRKESPCSLTKNSDDVWHIRGVLLFHRRVLQELRTAGGRRASKCRKEIPYNLEVLGTLQPLRFLCSLPPTPVFPHYYHETSARGGGGVRTAIAARGYEEDESGIRSVSVGLCTRVVVKRDHAG